MAPTAENGTARRMISVFATDLRVEVEQQEDQEQRQRQHQRQPLATRSMASYWPLHASE